MTIKAKSDKDRERKALFEKEPRMPEGEGTKDVGEDGDKGVEGDGQDDWVDEDAEGGNAKVQVDDEAQVEEDVVVADNSDKPVHEGFYCDGCKMTPIVGTRYKCLE